MTVLMERVLAAGRGMDKVRGLAERAAGRAMPNADGLAAIASLAGTSAPVRGGRRAGAAEEEVSLATADLPVRTGPAAAVPRASRTGVAALVRLGSAPAGLAEGFPPARTVSPPGASPLASSRMAVVRLAAIGRLPAGRVTAPGGTRGVPDAALSEPADRGSVAARVRGTEPDLIVGARPIAPVGAAAPGRLEAARPLEAGPAGWPDHRWAQGAWSASSMTGGGAFAAGQGSGLCPADGAPTIIQGDVMLDGAAVGRWVSRALTRDLRRPDVGPTGVDGRRDPVLPGIAVGG